LAESEEFSGLVSRGSAAASAAPGGSCGTGRERGREAGREGGRKGGMEGGREVSFWLRIMVDSFVARGGKEGRKRRRRL